LEGVRFSSSNGKSKTGYLLAEIKKMHFDEYRDNDFKALLVKKNLIDDKGWPNEAAMEYDYLRVVPRISDDDMFSPGGFNIVVSPAGISLLETLKFRKIKMPDAKAKA